MMFLIRLRDVQVSWPPRAQRLLRAAYNTRFIRRRPKAPVLFRVPEDDNFAVKQIFK